jgi:hypothetical protein
LGVDEITKMIIDDLAEFYINELDSSSKVDDILDNFSYSSSVNSENNCSGTDDEQSNDKRDEKNGDNHDDDLDDDDEYDESGNS